ncbi:MAG: hypothetical protein QM504_07295 [Pseudomonadota bacterium]
MLKNQARLILVFMFLVTFGCSSNTSKEELIIISSQLQVNINKVKKEVNALIIKAEVARKKAASVGGEWRDTAKFIKQAKQFQKNGQCEKAIKVIKKAVREAEMGYQQMVKQKQSYMPGYFKF